MRAILTSGEVLIHMNFLVESLYLHRRDPLDFLHFKTRSTKMKGQD